MAMAAIDAAPHDASRLSFILGKAFSEGGLVNVRSCGRNAYVRNSVADRCTLYINALNVNENLDWPG